MFIRWRYTLHLPQLFIRDQMLPITRTIGRNTTVLSGPSSLPFYRNTIECHAPMNLTRLGQKSAFLLQLHPVTFPSSFQGLSNKSIR